MENQNWNQIGKEIKDIVQDAINTRDFSQLNETVTQTVQKVGEQVNQSFQKAGRNRTQYVDPDPTERAKPHNREGAVPHGAGTYADGSRVRFTDRWVNMPQKREPQTFARVNGLRTKAYAQALTGGLFGAGFGIGLLITLSALFLSGRGIGVGSLMGLLMQLALCIGSFFLFYKGLTGLGCLNRYRSYVQLIKDRSYYELEELARRTGKKLGYIKKDVKKMLGYGWFPEGNLDEKETCLIVTKEAYAQYQAAQREYEERKRKEALFPNEKKELSPQVRAILEAGHGYLEKIRICNDRIPGEEISQKISRMELLIQRIFEQVKKKPEAADDLKKMMQYYLPTTVKLLDAYADMDDQPVQGENMASAKKEIEDTLDTLNVAFEKLLDEIFKDLAWDVSTDISVLHTLLAQEGLTKEHF